MWYHDDWQYRIKLTVQASKVEDNLADFPVYVDLSLLPEGFWTNVKDGGGDIRITTADGETELPREVVSCDTSTDTGELHFLADELSDSVDTDFYVYYGNSGASDYATDATYGAENVWDDSYEAVYHLQESSGVAIDSTANGNNAALGSNITQGEDSKIGKGYLIAHNGGLQLQSYTPGSGVTVEAWVYKSLAWVSYDVFYSYGSNYVAFRDSLNTRQAYFNGSDSVIYAALSGVAGSINAWHNYALIERPVGGNVTLEGYRDGTLVSSSNRSDGYTPHNVTDLFARSGTTLGINGLVDEARVSNIARSAHWIATEYNNQSAPATFFDIGTQEDNEEPPVGEGSIDYIEEKSDTTAQSTYTFTGVDFGDADSERYIIVGISTRKAGTGGSISSVTIGGVSATITQQVTNTAGSNNSTVGIAIAKVPSGSSGSVVITLSEQFLRCGIGVWRATNLENINADDTDTSVSTNPSGSLNISGAGFMIGVSKVGQSSSATWSGLDEDYDTAFQTFTTHTGAHREFLSSQTNHSISISWSVNGSDTAVFASWIYASAPPSGSTLKVWSGSAWVEKPLKVWSGSAWVEAILKRWTGSAWE